MKAVMYHYVRQFSEKRPHFTFLHHKDFCRQLDFFEKEFGFVSQSEWQDFVCNNKMPPDPGKVLLTFDDALSCHYDFVFPELKSRGLWGFFFIPTGPYTSEQILDVHKIHLLCGAVDQSLLNNDLDNLTNKYSYQKGSIRGFHGKSYKFQSNAEGIKRFKENLNYFFRISERSRLLDVLMEKYEITDDARDFYMKVSQMGLMKKEGMIFGSHSVSHPVMSKLEFDDQMLEIKDSFNFLRSCGLTDENVYCHPHGGEHTYDFNTLRILKKLNVDYSFDAHDHREITLSDLEDRRFSLPRFNCNVFPHGSIYKYR